LLTPCQVRSIRESKTERAVSAVGAGAWAEAGRVKAKETARQKRACLMSCPTPEPERARHDRADILGP
jgi:hypothetical protein